MSHTIERTEDGWGLVFDGSFLTYDTTLSDAAALAARYNSLVSGSVLHLRQGGPLE